ncbi:TIR domain-containing protein [Halomonas sp. ML-15]|nr:TIR domain-containing protein [Halomonas sp. ML-15]
MCIFVSYTTRDYYVDRELLESMCEVLSGYGDFYIDLLHNNSSDKQRHVEIMLSQAKLLLLISSSSIGKSEWVRWELTEAERISIPIITVQATSDRNETLSNLRSKLAAGYEKLTSCYTRINYSLRS